MPKNEGSHKKQDRHHGRILAFQLLYQQNKLPHTSAEAWYASSITQGLSLGSLAFARLLGETITRRQAKIDQLIAICLSPPGSGGATSDDNQQETAKQQKEKKWQRVSREQRGWKPERLTLGLHTLLRVGIAELLSTARTPAPVVIAETIGICATFLGQEQIGLCNAILDRVAKKQLSKPAAPTPTCGATAGSEAREQQQGIGSTSISLDVRVDSSTAEHPPEQKKQPQEAQAGDLLYFAYGSNLSWEQMRERCPRAIPLSQAELPDYRLEFAPFSPGWQGGGATITRHRGAVVPGGLYRMSRYERDALDVYEKTPKVYQHLAICVIDRQGIAHDAFTYIASDTPQNMPSARYLHTILRGMQNFEIDAVHLSETLARIGYSGGYAFLSSGLLQSQQWSGLLKPPYDAEETICDPLLLLTTKGDAKKERAVAGKLFAITKESQFLKSALFLSDHGSISGCYGLCSIGSEYPAPGAESTGSVGTWIFEEKQDNDDTGDHNLQDNRVIGMETIENG